jgi:predicted ATPase
MPKTEGANLSEAEPGSAIGQTVSLVGRAHELQQMRAALRAALAGSGRLVLLTSEPGIGKTRLAEELAREARASAAHVLWARCWEGEGAPAYWPWVQILRNAEQEIEPGWLAEMGPAAQYIAEMIPELRPALPSSDVAPRTPGLPAIPPSADRPERARFQLFDSISSLLRSAARARPLVLILDDLHNADPDSLLLLMFLARDLARAAILCIGTYREVEVRRSSQHAPLMAQIVREANCIPLRGLGSREIRQLVDSGLGFRAERTLLESLAATTEGNPFFLGEIVRLMKAESGFAASGTSEVRFNIPDSIQATVHRRLSPLSENARRALTIASAIGNEFEFLVLLQVSQLAENLLGEALQEAAALGLLTETAPSGHYRFAHAITPEVLRTEISRRELPELHRRIATTIERFHRKQLDNHAAEIAAHYEHAFLSDDQKRRSASSTRIRSKVVAYARRGANQAIKQLAYSEAARLCKMALNALDSSSG